MRPRCRHSRYRERWCCDCAGARTRSRSPGCGAVYTGRVSNSLLPDGDGLYKRQQIFFSDNELEASFLPPCLLTESSDKAS
jgi:hypothetical protein